jgi:NAD(P)-dependent dehydrogenase (short-subunit alcohol dehydrogenase family)
VPDSTDFLGLRGRVILVTGASSGIGRQTAVAAARHGARIACLARRDDELQALLGILDGEGHIAVPFDVTDHAGIPAMMRGVVDRMGPVDGLVHAAGVHATSPLRTVTEEQVSRLFNINVTSAVMLAKAFRHARVRGERPSVVLLSSTVGLVGEAGVSVYAASKAAVASLAKSLGLELAREGIRVNAIAAGMVGTALADGIRSAVGDGGWAAIEAAHPLGIGTADDVANAALYLLSSASGWVTGTALIVDGGYTAR